MRCDRLIYYLLALLPASWSFAQLSENLDARNLSELELSIVAGESETDLSDFYAGSSSLRIHNDIASKRYSRFSSTLQFKPSESIGWVSFYAKSSEDPDPDKNQILGPHEKTFYTSSEWKQYIFPIDLHSESKVSIVLQTTNLDKPTSIWIDSLSFTPGFLVQPEASNGTTTITPEKNNYELGEPIEIRVVPNGEHRFRYWTNLPTELELNGKTNPILLQLEGHVNPRANLWKVTAIDNYEVLIPEDTEIYSVNNENTNHELAFGFEDGFAIEAEGPGVLEFLIYPMSGRKPYFSVDGEYIYKYDRKSELSSSVRVPVPRGKQQLFFRLHNGALVNGISYAEGTSFSLQGKGSGTLKLFPDKPTYIPGESVELTAEPDAGWEFLRFEGDINSTQNPLLLAASNAQEITAVFGRNKAFADLDWKYETELHDDSAGNETWDSITVSSSTTLKSLSFTTSERSTDPILFSTILEGPGIFETTAIMDGPTNSNSLKLSLNGEGIDLVQPDQTLYTKLYIPSGSHRLTGSASFPYNPTEELLTINLANLSWRQGYELITSSAFGDVKRSPDKTLYDRGEVVSLTAIPHEDATFLGWNGDATSESPTIDFELVDHSKITAQMGKTVHASGATWTLSGDLPWEFIDSAEASSGKLFKIDQITPKANAWFQTELDSPARIVYRYKTLGDNPAHINAANGQLIYEHWPNAQWSEHSIELHFQDEPFRIALKPTTTNYQVSPILVEIASIEVGLNVLDKTGGNLEFVPAKQYYQIGEQVMLTATADRNHEFAGWYGNAEGEAASFSFTVEPGLTFAPIFKPKQLLSNIEILEDLTTDWRILRPQIDEFDLVSQRIGESQSTVIAFEVEGPGELRFDPRLGVNFEGIPSTRAFLNDEEIDIELDFDRLQFYSRNFPPGKNTLRLEFSHNSKNSASYFWLNEPTFQPGYSVNDYTSGGTVTLSPSKERYDTGDTVTFGIVEDFSNQFVSWSGDFSGTDSVTTKTITDNIEFSVLMKGPANYRGVAAVYDGNNYFHVQDRFKRLSLIGNDESDSHASVQFDLEGPGQLSFQLKTTAPFGSAGSSREVYFDDQIIHQDFGESNERGVSTYHLTKRIEAGSHTLKIIVNMPVGEERNTEIDHFSFLKTFKVDLEQGQNHPVELQPEMESYPLFEWVSVKIPDEVAGNLVLSNLSFNPSYGVSSTRVSDREIQFTSIYDVEVSPSFLMDASNSRSSIYTSFDLSTEWQTLVTKSEEQAIKISGDWGKWESKYAHIPSQGACLLSLSVLIPEGMTINFKQILRESDSYENTFLTAVGTGDWRRIHLAVRDGNEGVTLEFRNRSDQVYFNSNIYIEGIQIEKGYSISYSDSLGGYIDVPILNDNPTPNETLTLSAIPMPGYTFSHWDHLSLDQSIADLTVPLHDSADHSYKAYFSPNVSFAGETFTHRGSSVSIRNATLPDNSERDAVVFEPNTEVGTSLATEVSGPSVLQFTYYTKDAGGESASNSSLEVTIDDTIHRFYGKASGERVSLPIPDGQHTIKFKYNSTTSLHDKFAAITDFSIELGFLVVLTYDSRYGRAGINPQKSVYQEGDSINLWASPKRYYYFYGYADSSVSDVAYQELVVSDHLELEALFYIDQPSKGSWKRLLTSDSTYEYEVAFTGPGALVIKDSNPYRTYLRVDSGSRILMDWKANQSDNPIVVPIPSRTHILSIKTDELLSANNVSLHNGLALSYSNQSAPVRANPDLPVHPFGAEVKLTVPESIKNQEGIRFNWSAPTISNSPTLSFNIQENTLVSLQLLKDFSLWDLDFTSAYPFWESGTDNSGIYFIRSPNAPSWLETNVMGLKSLNLHYYLSFGPPSSEGTDHLVMKINNSEVFSTNENPNTYEGTHSEDLSIGPHKIRFIVNGENVVILSQISYVPYSVDGYTEWSAFVRQRNGADFDTKLGSDPDNDNIPNWLEYLLGYAPEKTNTLLRTAKLSFNGKDRICAILPEASLPHLDSIRLSYIASSEQSPWTTTSLEQLEHYQSEWPIGTPALILPLDQFNGSSVILKANFDVEIFGN
ncbi:hypothetical protein VDG1235_2338 [Verrucomicrobiia bacterium DG1235]|nr:hypothetical protein VDG1235_2338 [Verrucomicrobiae bacterium DG1235]